MSSIDKYVEEEAHKQSARVRVTNIGGRIIGRIGGEIVFDIADRYGYLSDGERQMIRAGIASHEIREAEIRRMREEEDRRMREEVRKAREARERALAEQRERERKEQERREAEQRERERVEKRTELKNAIDSARAALTRSHEQAKSACDSAVQGNTLAQKLSALKAYNVAGYQERVRAIEAKLHACDAQIEREFQAQLAELEGFSNVRANDTKEAYESQKSRVQSVKTAITGVTLPTDEIKQMESELDALAKALKGVENLERELKSVPKEGLMGSIAKAALGQIKTKTLGALDDVDALISDLVAATDEIRAAAFHSQNKETLAVVSRLDGAAQACTKIRPGNVIEDYRRAVFRAQIEEAAKLVEMEYTALRNAEYTTCSQDEIQKACDTAQKALLENASDEAMLEELNKLLDQCSVHKGNDSLQRDNYRDYQEKVAELRQCGYKDEIPAFNPHAYDKGDSSRYGDEGQRLELAKRLVAYDIEKEADNTRNSFLSACEVMQEMGYRALSIDIGQEEKDTLACEAIYAIPGCDGVVLKLLVYDNKIVRKLVGIQRTSGATTSVERVLEVAEKLEQSGQIEAYYENYAKVTGGSLSVNDAVESNDENAAQAVEANGCLVLTETEERAFDDVMKRLSTKEEKETWGTQISRNENVNTISKTAERECGRLREECREALMKKRLRPHAD